MILDHGFAHRFIYEFMRALDCPRSLTAWLMFTNNEHLQLANLEFNPFDYNSKREAEDALAATKFLSKATFLSTNIDKEAVALEKFFAAEAQCGETNRRIRSSQFKNPETRGILLSMSRKISNILGDIIPDELIDACNWGPGATTSIKRRQATHPTKFQIESEITADAYDFVVPFFSAAYPLWKVDFKIRNTSKIVTVPKNAKTDRTIAIEPGINLWFQKGIGTVFRKRLKGIGIDLNTQDHNAEKARLGSKFGTLATVDFSAASDTIARKLVEEILPSDWLLVCQAFRSNSCLLKGTPIYLEKFSSMGNGFTFELESLIFYSLAVACCDCLGVSSKEISVYGDDVIIPSDAVDLFTAISADLGFTVNTEKSYSSSYYRESCGEHFWAGNRVKPIFLKEPLKNAVDIVKLANNVRRMSHRRLNNLGCDKRLRRCWLILSGKLGAKFPRISDGYGDVALVENIDIGHSSITKPKGQLEGIRVRLWATAPIKLIFDGQGLFLQKLKAIDRPTWSFWFDPIDNTYLEDRFLKTCVDPDGDGNNIPLPGRVKHTRVSVLVPRWYDLGPWV